MRRRMRQEKKIYKTEDERNATVHSHILYTLPVLLLIFVCCAYNSSLKEAKTRDKKKIYLFARPPFRKSRFFFLLHILSRSSHCAPWLIYISQKCA